MLQLKNIRKSYDGKVILDSISLDINDGEIVSILGPSGSGKTTLLNAILGLTEIDGGQIIFDGKDLTNVPMKDRGFNIVFQDYALFPNLNAYENIVYGLRNKPGISSAEEVQELISLLGLKEHLNKRIEALTLSDKVLIINEGQISQFDQPHVIVTQPRTQFVEKFILSQLRIKRDNIFRLFGEPCAFAGVAR